MKKVKHNLYLSYLLKSRENATLINLSVILNKIIRHNKITRFSSARVYTLMSLWEEVKSAVCQIKSENEILIFAVFKLECLKLKTKLNHFTLRSKIFIKPTQQLCCVLRHEQTTAA